MLLSEIAATLGLARQGNDVAVERPALLDDAGPGTLCLAMSSQYAALAADHGVAAILTTLDADTTLPCLRAVKPRIAFARLLQVYDHRPTPPPGIHSTAVVADSAQVDSTASVDARAVVEAGAAVGARTRIGAGAYVGHESAIGADSVIGPGVMIYDRCTLGQRVRIQAGTVIGSDGYGYEWDGTEHVRVPHLGVVVLEDDVELGANCCVDRGKTGETRIGRGTKIDNLVQIGHGATVGRFCLMAAQVGVAGSATLGAGVVLAGQVGIADHLTVGAGAIVGAKSAVLCNLPGGRTYLGVPAREVSEMRRIIAVQPRLPSMLHRLRALERRAGEDGESA